MRIPPDRHPEILRRAGSGESAAQIAAWLATEGIKVSDRAVRKLLERVRTERADATKAVVREQLQQEALGDVAHLEAARLRAAEIEKAAGEIAQAPDLDPKLKLRALTTQLDAIEAQRKIVDTKLHYAGADEPDAAAQAMGIVILPPEQPD